MAHLDRVEYGVWPVRIRTRLMNIHEFSAIVSGLSTGLWGVCTLSFLQVIRQYVNQRYKLLRRKLTTLRSALPLAITSASEVKVEAGRCRSADSRSWSGG